MKAAIRNIILLLVGSSGLPGLLMASVIHTDLQEKINASPDESYRAYIVMPDGRDGLRLVQSLELDRYTREAGHAIAIRHLKETAEASQSRLLEYLGAQSAQGNVSWFKSHWIENIVSVRAKGSLLEEIPKRHNVEAIYECPVISLIEPVETFVIEESRPEVLAEALKVIGADSMWALGYTGKGRLVCSFDTGVFGMHPALSSSWRGNNGHSWQESWFDPAYGDSFPHTTPIRPLHGTHTMGIIVGHDDATGDTVGVALDAQWISAAVIDVPGADILDGFEWAADPDGNPNTVTDVPDVVSHSWGYRSSVWAGCEDVFWGAIDNLEALGAACVFACGNDGTAGSQTIVNPANRASSPYNAFAVGMVDADSAGFPVDVKSSQGPSDCDGVSLKPQVVAPGVDIRSTVPGENGSYGYNTGTSMACPHVAGAVALLRQYNPNAPVDSMKKALMETAIDVEEPGLDFKSGHGMIHIPSALEILVPNNAPNIYVSTIARHEPNPGDTIEISLSLGNSGLGLTNVQAVLRSTDPNAAVLDSSFVFGNIPLDGEVTNEGSPFRVVFDPGIIAGSDFSLVLHVTGSDSYLRDIPLVFTVGEKPVRSTFVHDAGNVTFAGSNFGHYGFAFGGAYDLGLPGFVWPNDGSGENNLYEMGLLVGVDEGHVSDNILNPIHKPDNDFEVDLGGGVRFLEPGEYSEEESFSIFDDSRAEHPIGLSISQRTFAFADPPHDDYVMIVLDILNTEDLLIENMVVGIYTDWDWPMDPSSGGARDRVGFVASADVGYMYDGDPSNSDYRGVAVLNGEGANSFRAIKWYPYMWDRDGGTDREKWDFMTGGIIDTSSYLLYPDHACLIATGGFDMWPGEVVRAAFAVIGASSVANLVTTTAAARQKYAEIASSFADTIPPSFNIGILPNPVLSFELDILAFASEPLSSAPHTTITHSVIEDTMTMTLLGDRDAIAYTVDYRVSVSDEYAVSVCGLDTSGNYGCSHRSFSAAPIRADEGASLTSESGLFSLSIPANSLARDALVILREDSLRGADNAGLGLPLDVEPIGLLMTKSACQALRSSATLSVDLAKLEIAFDEVDTVALFRLGNSEACRLQSRFDPDESTLIAEVSRFGTYLVGLSTKTADESDQGTNRPSAHSLDQNHPNPFNIGTTISFDLPNPARVRLDIYNILGQKVVTLLDQQMPSGSHEVYWNGRNSDDNDCSSGVYFYRIQSGSFSDVKRMVMLK